MYMTCPKCGGQMQSFTRSGLTIEQCNQCRGVFLDYGELEHIVKAEASWHQQHYPQQGVAQPGHVPPGLPGMHQPGHRPHLAYHGHHAHHRGHHNRSFMGELFGM